MACFCPPPQYPPPQYPMPVPMPMPMRAPPSAPPLYGKTMYKYFTRDGGPPNQGKPPTSSSSSGAPPSYGTFAPFPQLPPPPYNQPGAFFMAPSNGFPGAVCVPNAPSASQPPSQSRPAAPQPYNISPPPPVPADIAAKIAHATSQAPEPPVSGNRVKDRLMVVKDGGGAGHVVEKNPVTFHLFTYNIMNKYDVNANQQFYIPPNACEPFRVMTASHYMPIQELIEQLDCVQVAPSGYPRYAIGLAEAFDLGNGWFQVGSKLMLDEPKSKMSIREAWGESIGEQGLTRPKWLIRLPGK